MNFIVEMNAFIQWLESESLSANAQLLWFKLFNLNNRCAWKEWMQVDNQRLMHFIKANSRNTMMRARDELVDVGLLEYKRGKKGVPGSYKMIPPSVVLKEFMFTMGSKNEQNNELCSDIEQNTGQNTDSIRTEYEHHMNPIYKHKHKHKPNINKKEIDKEKKAASESSKKKNEEEDILAFVSGADFSDKVKEALKDFVAMRKSIKKPMTLVGIKCLVSQLKKMESAEERQLQILNNSIISGWKGIFPLKDGGIKNGYLREGDASNTGDGGGKNREAKPGGSSDKDERANADFENFMQQVRSHDTV